MYLKVINNINKTISEYKIDDNIKTRTTKGDFSELDDYKFIEAYEYIVDLENSLKKYIDAVYWYYEEMDQRSRSIKTMEDLKYVQDMYNSKFLGIQYSHDDFLIAMDDFRDRFNFCGDALRQELACYGEIIDHIERVYNENIRNGIQKQLQNIL